MAIFLPIEATEGVFNKGALEVLSYGASLGKLMQTKVVVLSLTGLGQEGLRQLGLYGVQKVIFAEETLLSLDDERHLADEIATQAISENAKILLFQSTSVGRFVAPRIAARLGAGFVSRVMGAPLSIAPLVFAKKVFSEKATARVRINTEVAVITLAKNSTTPAEEASVVEVQPLKVIKGLGENVTTVRAVNKTVGGAVLMSDAEIIVSGGRGMRGPENWGAIEDLAKELGAATACTRPVADSGWRPHHEHVGQTGKAVAPTLYIACGISGAIQHLAGISSSKFILSINKDGGAPIFESSQFGVVGDLATVLPKFTEAIRKFKRRYHG